MPEQEPQVDEQCAKEDRESEVRADLVPHVPEDHLGLYREQVEDTQENEAVVIVPEFLIILFERIDPRKKGKQGNAPDHDEGNEKEAGDFIHGPVSLAGRVPVRRDHIRKGRVSGSGRQDRNDNARNYGEPDEFHG